MSENIFEIIHYSTNICVALPFAMQIFAYIICGSYKRAALDIHNTNKEIFRSIKLRYTNSAKLGIPLEDSRSFVYKYLYGAGGPFKMPSALDKISCLIYCGALLSTTALFLHDHIGLYRMIGVLAASFCFFIFRNAFSVARQMELTVEFSVDYLDNTLKHRLMPEKKVSRPVESQVINASQTTNEVHNTSIGSDASVNSTKNLEEKKPEQPSPITEENTTPAMPSIKFNLNTQESDIIESVLQEFLA